MTSPDAFAAVLSALEGGATRVIVDNGDTRYVLNRTPHTRLFPSEGQIRGVQLEGPVELLERLGSRKTTTVARAIAGNGTERVVHRGHLDIGRWWRTGQITNVASAE